MNILIKEINMKKISFQLFQDNNMIGILDTTIRNLDDNEKDFIKKKGVPDETLDLLSCNIDWIEIYKDKIKYKPNFRIGSYFLNYCILYIQSKYNVKFSTLDNCIDSLFSKGKSNINFYKDLGYDWIDFDYIENKPNGPEMIKIL